MVVEPTAIVRIKNIDFHPHKLTVAPGSKVTWKFLDKVVSHTITSSGKDRFKSDSGQRTGTYSVTFSRTGTYHYHCTIHPNMQARIVVK